MSGLIQRYQESHLHDNAIFLAERLYAQASTAENLYVLARSFYVAGKPRRAHFLLHRATQVPDQVKALLGAGPLIPAPLVAAQRLDSEPA